MPASPLAPDPLLLSSWGLPSAVLAKYSALGLSCLFPWQAEALRTGRALEGGNLLYSAPTSAGKTLVAELLMLKRLLETKRKALVILPYVAVSREKVASLSVIYGEAGLKVGGFMGSYSHSPPGGFAAVDVAVCTIEKANSLMNRLVEENRASEIGCVVVDELHMVGDASRGHLIELLLTKIRFVSARNASSADPNPIQILGMSATLPNLDLLAEWLEADLYVTDFRPVPLRETVKIGDILYDAERRTVGTIGGSGGGGDEDNLFPLVLETIVEGHGVLIFCPTKKQCETIAESLAKKIYATNSCRATPDDATASASFRRVPLDSAGLIDVQAQLGRTPAGLDKRLAPCVRWGVCFHHAGLTFDERDVLEGAFKRGLVKVVVATSTLSSGVNLPARRVIVRSPTFYGRPLEIGVYKQMIGRAGRKGVDTLGESILMARPHEKEKAFKLLTGDLNPVVSSLDRRTEENNNRSGRAGKKSTPELSAGLKRAVLEVTVNGLATTVDDIRSYMDCTLLTAAVKRERKAAPAPPIPVAISDDPVELALDFLEKEEFLEGRNREVEVGVAASAVSSTRVFVPSQLGAAVLASALSPDEGLSVFRELETARRCFVLENELHLVYHVTPIYQKELWAFIDWQRYYDIFSSLPADARRVADAIGIRESFLVQCATRGPEAAGARNPRLLHAHRRFYGALMLHDLINEAPLEEVSLKYGVARGSLQSAQTNAGTFAGMVHTFCNRLGWNCLELLLAQFQDRLAFGVQRDLCDLVRIPLLNSARARALFKSGHPTVSSLATAKPGAIEIILRNAVAFESKRRRVGETEAEAEERLGRGAGMIYVEGRKDGLTPREAATEIILEARKIVEEQLGAGGGIRWASLSQGGGGGGEDDEENETIEKEKKKVSANENESTKSNLIDEKLNQTREKQDSTSTKHNPSPTKQNPNLDKPNSRSETKSSRRNHAIEKQIRKNLNLKNEKLNPVKDLSESDEISFPIPKIDSMANESGSDRCRENVDREQPPNLKQNVNLSDANNVIDVDSTTTNIPAPSSLPHCSSTSTSPSSQRHNRSIREMLVGQKKRSGKRTFPQRISEKTIQVETESKTENEEGNQKVGVKIGDEESSWFLSRAETRHEFPSPTKMVVSTSLTSTSSKVMTKVTNLSSTSTTATATSTPASMITTASTTATTTPTSTACRMATIAAPVSNRVAANDVADPDGLVRFKSRLSEITASFFMNDTQDIFGGEASDAATSSPRRPTDEDRLTDKEIDRLMADPFESQPVSGSCSTPGVVAPTPEWTPPFVEDRSLSPEIGMCGVIDGRGPSKPAALSSSLSKRKRCSDALFSDVEIVEEEENEVVEQRGGKKEGRTNATHEISIARNRRRTSSVRRKRRRRLDDLSRRSDDSAEGILDDDKSQETKAPLVVQRIVDEDANSSRERSPLIVDTQLAADIDFAKNHLAQSADFSELSLSASFTESGLSETDEGLSLSIAAPSSTLNDLHPHPDPTAAHAPCETLAIVDVFADPEIAVAFELELRRQRIFAASIACEKKPAKRDAAPKIGANFRREATTEQSRQSSDVPSPTFDFNDADAVVGVAFCWSGRETYYLSLTPGANAAASLDDSLVEAPPHEDLTLEKRIDLVRRIFSWDTKSRERQTRVFYDAKLNWRTLSEVIGVVPSESLVEDPKVALWLLDPDSKEEHLPGMATRWAPEVLDLLDAIGGTYGRAPLGLTTKNGSTGRIRACTEAVVVRAVMERLRIELTEKRLDQVFRQVEMPIVISLAKMEANGFGFSENEAAKQTKMLQGKLEQVEREAFRLAGHSFSLTSPAEVAKVLYVEQNLPTNDADRPNSGKGKLLALRGRARLPKNMSTAKDKLEKLVDLHPLPGVVLEHRRLAFSVTKCVEPLNRMKVVDDRVGMHRIHGETLFHTATGRVSMQEPNLQNIPNDFEIETSLQPSVESDSSFRLFSPEKISSKTTTTTLSMRHAFVPFAGGVLLAADYSQLELRVIAHLSADPVLLSILNGDGDVFRQIAGAWLDVAPDDVSTEKRTWVKRICYGMIYGIGPASLARQLGLEETRAAEFMATFLDNYAGLKRFLTDAVGDARRDGFVETIAGRKRFLKDIDSTNAVKRAHAERQAVNTRVQGSAADLVKRAMINAERALENRFPDCRTPHRGVAAAVVAVRKPPRGAFLVLQLHDELIYETNAEDVADVAAILKAEMENAMPELSVKFPVKLKVGTSWGSMRDLELD